MSLPRYPRYKDSGIAWVGNIPEGWLVWPLVGIATERCESNIGMREDNLLSLSYGRIVRKDIASHDGLLPESFETYQVVHAGDIVLRLTDLQNDKRSLRSAHVDEKGIITSAYLALQANRVSSKYLAYLLRGYDLTKVFYSMGGGLRQSMKFSDVKRMPVLVPSKTEQSAIAGFLDREVSKIDSLIAEQEKLGVLLAEKRRATISHAVTRGLDPDAPMKDSGVVWLGEIPKHWSVTRLKHLMSSIVDCPHETPVYDDDGVHKVIRTADIAEGKLFTSDMYRVNALEYLNRIRRQPLKTADIVYGREGERWGFAALVPSDNVFCLGQRMMQFRSLETACAPYLMWALNAVSTYRQGQMDTVGATSPHVNIGTIRNYTLANPPMSEQRSISAFLEAETGRLDTLEAESERAISLLKERRSALITAAVTGQIDVRGAVQSPEPAIADQALAA